MKVALKSNCDRRDDQVRKIREYLKNHPLSLVPENLDNVDAAFSTPKSLYGDPSHMMKRKKDKLLSRSVSQASMVPKLSLALKCNLNG